MSFLYRKSFAKIFILFFVIIICFLSQKIEEDVVLSVIMPVYNRETFVGKAIESVLKQTYRNFELIIVDDNSRDNSLKVIKKYAQKDPRIKVYALPKNKGVSHARNFAISKANGKYLDTMDSDDQAYDDWLEKSVGFMEKNPHVVHGFVKADVYDDDGS